MPEYTSAFQFLMVRLKDYLSCQRSNPGSISIPYGSIKSILRRLRSSFAGYISIPYGSIKRKKWLHFVQRFFGFQFLMVRLKGTVWFAGCWFFRISIPYGSIKRVHSFWPETPSRISIPYGSIKSASLSFICQVTGISIPYGSIKSRLHGLWKDENQISIPYGSIKSFYIYGRHAHFVYFNSLWFD